MRQFWTTSMICRLCFKYSAATNSRSINDEACRLCAPCSKIAADHLVWRDR